MGLLGAHVSLSTGPLDLKALVLRWSFFDNSNASAPLFIASRKSISSIYLRHFSTFLLFSLIGGSKVSAALFKARVTPLLGVI